VKRSLVIIICLLVLVAAVSCRSMTGRSAGEVVDDTTITTAINAKIVEDPDLSYLKINVNSFQGDVTLSGVVPSKAAEERLIKMAKEVKGVKSVTSNLKIEKE
jgi:hyperosmotically inducible protein